MAKRTKRNPFFEDIKKGLHEAIDYLEGRPGNYRVHHIYPPPKVDAKKLRKKLGLSQMEFTLRFGIPAATLRNWEQGRREPDLSTRILLAIIDRHPEIVDEVLGRK